MKADSQLLKIDIEQAEAALHLLQFIDIQVFYSMYCIRIYVQSLFLSFIFSLFCNLFHFQFAPFALRNIDESTLCRKRDVFFLFVSLSSLQSLSDTTILGI